MPFGQHQWVLPAEDVSYAGAVEASAIMTAATTKTDEKVRSDVEAELDSEPSLRASEIGVAVRDGIVTLSGNVDSLWRKWNAERATERVAGVRGVANEIQVNLAHERTDTDIAHSVANVLEWSSPVPRDQVKAEVEKGWVTLNGEVAYDYQRRAAERAVRHIDGVRGISNRITIKPRANPIDVRARIERAFERLSRVDAERITIQASDGEVTLRGSVRSWSERYEAQKAAYAAPGVHTVHNYLTVRED
jgi:osmotically-inducible protein OsmY